MMVMVLVLVVVVVVIVMVVRMIYKQSPSKMVARLDIKTNQ